MRVLYSLGFSFVLSASPSGGGPLEGAVHVTNDGPKAVRVLVGAGDLTPCDSNSKAFDGTVMPEKTVSFTTRSACVCVQSTVSPFAGTDFGPASVLCRPNICKPVSGKNKVVCVPDMSAPISARVRSSP